jgi:hypothetical protein
MQTIRGSYHPTRKEYVRGVVKPIQNSHPHVPVSTGHRLGWVLAKFQAGAFNFDENQAAQKGKMWDNK